MVYYGVGRVATLNRVPGTGSYTRSSSSIVTGTPGDPSYAGTVAQSAFRRSAIYRRFGRKHIAEYCGWISGVPE